MSLRQNTSKQLVVIIYLISASFNILVRVSIIVVAFFCYYSLATPQKTDVDKHQKIIKESFEQPKILVGKIPVDKYIASRS